MASAHRPTPILADRILSQPEGINRRIGEKLGKNWWAQTRQNLRSSQKFVLTNTAVDNIIEAMRAFPEQLVLNSKFAHPPHELTWLESGHHENMGDRNTGYLINHGTVTTIFEGDNPGDDGVFLPTPFIISLNQPSTKEEQKAFMDWVGFTEEQFERSFWGNLYDSMPKRLRDKMRMQHKVSFIPSMERIAPHTFEKVRENLDMGIRMVVGTLLAFNQPKSPLYMTLNNAQRRLTSKGNKTFLAHSVVEMNLAKKKEIRFNYRHAGGTHDSPRWHPVKGHYVHSHKARSADCSHGFGNDPDWWQLDETYEGERWVCTGCGGKRTWRDVPEGRGDGSKGMVLHHHVVTHNPDA